MDTKQPTADQYREAARRLFHRDGEIEVDENAIISRDECAAESEGAYVAAWVWVPREEATPETAGQSDAPLGRALDDAAEQRWLDAHAGD